MQVPVELVFQHCDPTDEIRSAVARQVERLERFSDRITSCRVVVAGPHSRHRQGDLYEVDVRIAMPGRKDVVVGKRREDAPERQHPLVAIREAFDLAVRQIEDAMRDMEGVVKEHAVEAHGKVSKFLAGADSGFIETPDGREIFFHRNAVLDEAFDRLSVGSEVRFVEEDGDKGPQASTVRVVGKHHLL